METEKQQKINKFNTTRCKRCYILNNYEKATTLEEKAEV